MAVRRNQARNVVLCGFHGCGKTSVGWELAKHMRRQFVDVPQELVRRARTAQARVPFWSKPLEPDEIEPRLVMELAQRRDLVIALGAGSLDDPDAFAETHEFAYMVFLDPPFDELYARLLHMPQHRDSVNALGRFGLLEQFERRRAAYEKSDLQITENLPPSRLSSLILHCFYT
jgi:shikimate kinase